MARSESETGRPRLANLDGLRAFSVLLVVAFHGRVLGLVGGFVGVSVFFTISGYLLTYRLLAAPLDTAAIRRYWAGRWRRILPAAWTVLLAVTLTEWVTDRAPVGAGHRLWTTAAGLGNWLQVWKGNGYAHLFEGGDSMLHYWSLGVEEQAYLLLPLALLLIVRLRRGGTRLGAVLGLAAVSFALPFVSGMSVARTYYGTDTRAGEILLGVALAVAHHGGVVSRRMPRRDGTLALLAGMGGITAIAFTVHAGDDVVRRGLLPALALLSVVAVHAAVSTPGALRGLLESRPVRFLGEASYPVYLLHWPIMVVLRWHDLPDPVVAAAGLGGAVLLSVPLTRLVERPLRRRAPRPVWFGWLAATTGVLALCVVAVKPPEATQFLADLEKAQATATPASPALGAAAVPDGTDTIPDSGAAPDPVPPGGTLAAATMAAGGTDGVGGSPPSSRPTTTVARGPGIAVFGDSAALSIALVVTHQVPRDRLNYVGAQTKIGCGLVESLAPERCNVVLANWAEFLSEHPVDVAVLMSCQWDVLERDLPGSGRHVVGDPEMDSIIVGEYRAALDVLLGHGVERVAWVLCPQFSQKLGDHAIAAIDRSHDPARVIALNRLIRQVAAERPGQVVLVDLWTWMQPHTDDADVRPDGAHFAYDHPTALSAALPDLLDAALAGLPTGSLAGRPYVHQRGNQQPS